MATCRLNRLGLNGRVWLASAAALVLAVPASADVKAGVDAWSRGDYPAAIREWQGPADKGDPDAMFNLGQAYRLGLGVTPDATKAEYYYARAAEGGHVRAADTYGLILFQTGRTQAAMPYIEGAAKRGDPRSQYLLGLAYFNGEIIAKDWVKAYALLGLANTQGLPQAGPALAQMDEYIPMAQRQQAASLAVDMQQQADQTRANELAAFDLSAVAPSASNSTPRTPQPVAQIDPAGGAFDDSKIAAAQDAVRQAALASGTEDPGQAGADFTRTPGGAAPTRMAVADPAPVPAVQPKPVTPKPPVAKPAAPKPAAATSSGPWKLQLGAFGVRGNAEKLWAQISRRPELSGKTRLLEPAGKLTKLLAGGFASRADASAACSRLQAAGQSCIVTQ